MSKPFHAVLKSEEGSTVPKSHEGDALLLWGGRALLVMFSSLAGIPKLHDTRNCVVYHTSFVARAVHDPHLASLPLPSQLDMSATSAQWETLVPVPDDSAADPATSDGAEWQTLVPAHLLKEGLDSDQCKTLVPLPMALEFSLPAALPPQQGFAQGWVEEESFLQLFV